MVVTKMVSLKHFNKSAHSNWILMILLGIALWEVECITKKDVENHLELGIQMLARGQLQDALGHFHDAVDGDPNNYVGYYRRATVYLALGRARAGLKDLDEVVKIKPDFTSARAQRASVLLKLGRLDEAYMDAEIILQKDSRNEEANRLFTTIYPLKEKLQYAHNAIDSKHYGEAISQLNEIIEECPWDPHVRELRLQAFLAIGDTMQAIGDLRAVTKQTQGNTDGLFRLSKLYYQTGDVGQALIEIRECLKLDPDHQLCFALYKKLKKVNKLVTNSNEYKENKEYTDCVSSAQKILKEELTVGEIRFIAYDMLCHCEAQAGQFQSAHNSCTSALQIREDPRIYCDRAEAHLLNEMFDEAVHDFHKALTLDEHYQRAKEGIDRSQKLKKQASKKDYYKILGVKRNANKKEITKAYRSLAQKWHPDLHDGEEKKKAEEKFITIAAAKEVLTDPEKRAKFDAGEDPLDPEQQANQGFHPFRNPHFNFRQGGGGGYQERGEPFEFKFQFN